MEKNIINNKSKINNSSEFVKNIFKVNIMELVTASILLSIHCLLILTAKFTILRVIPVQLEFVLYIFYGLLLGPFKGGILAIIGDTLLMLLTGSIGTWFWLYAIVPPLISIVSWLYLIMFQKTKYTRFIVSFALTISAFIITIYIYLSHCNEDGTFSLTKKIAASKTLIMIMIVVLGVASILISIVFTTLYFVTKNEKWNYYMMVTSLIIFISVIFRWVLGPVSYIEWFNYIHHANENSKLKHYGTDFIILFVKIVIKDLFVIPIYISVLTPIFVVASILKEKYLINYKKNRY
ncbi:hypothetical protein KQ874_02695 [Mycoplasma sp. ES3157-GEN-MYC]|uniref:Uncharacterized protein n=1 Tax=Mycoplasma miroungigenitalium TaxID=754515 RepID=A0A6M4J9N4_9MOLU|nr:hypothetical protein [Mycoplasma miroungigenitalium]MBU4690587.1 hypothetical protein [Mycoplasma miroungigenitalium]MBU4691854.1 hypothetical protein [Mycoplasma miroungigenitalium]QJR43714.1 hypothetical protein HLA87_02900 [Mycoplasma miroungigenitalium]